MALKKVLFLDFDETITIIHTHDHKASGILAKKDENKKAKIANIRHPLILRAIINKWQKQDNVVGILTFNSGPLYKNDDDAGEVYVRQYITEGIPGIDHDSLGIVAFERAEQDNGLGKEPHMASYFKVFNQDYPKEKIDIDKKEDMERVILVDDSAENVNHAIKMGAIHSILVPTRSIIVENTVIGTYPAKNKDEDYLIKLMLLVGLTPEELIKETSELEHAETKELKEEYDFVQGLIKSYKVAYENKMKTNNTKDVKSDVEKKSTKEMQSKPPSNNSNNSNSSEDKRKQVLSQFITMYLNNKEFFDKIPLADDKDTNKNSMANN